MITHTFSLSFFFIYQCHTLLPFYFHKNLGMGLVTCDVTSIHVTGLVEMNYSSLNSLSAILCKRSETTDCQTGGGGMLACTTLSYKASPLGTQARPQYVYVTVEKMPTSVTANLVTINPNVSFRAFRIAWCGC